MAVTPVVKVPGPITITGVPSQIAVAGGSIINIDSVTIWLNSDENNAASDSLSIPLTGGSALPWPSNVPCYAYTKNDSSGNPQSGSAVLTPIYAAYTGQVTSTPSPGTEYGPTFRAYPISAGAVASQSSISVTANGVTKGDVVLLAVGAQTTTSPLVSTMTSSNATWARVGYSSSANTVSCDLWIGTFTGQPTSGKETITIDLSATYTSTACGMIIGNIGSTVSNITSSSGGQAYLFQQITGVPAGGVAFYAAFTTTTGTSASALNPLEQNIVMTGTDYSNPTLTIMAAASLAGGGVDLGLYTDTDMYEAYVTGVLAA